MGNGRRGAKERDNGKAEMKRGIVRRSLHL
jgi:hypothetical protein